MDLPDSIYDKVTSLSEAGNAHMDAEEWDKAIVAFQQALQLLPEPKRDWEAFTWLNGSLGDAFYMNQQFAEAKDALFDALNGPDGLENPFLHLRLGEVCHELKDMARAKDHLLRAYMLEGKEIFEDEPDKYFQVIASEV